MINCCIGIMAYNEEANIGRLLEALLIQQAETVNIEKIIIVASGCTDTTEAIVEKFTVQDGRIQLLKQPRREGKASAVNLLLKNTQCEIVVLQSADTLPTPHTIEALVLPFVDPRIGMVGGRPVPTNPDHTFMGYGVHLLWELHHQVALRRPKMGELIAFRNIFRQIPHDSAVDEASIEPLIVGQGLSLVYAPEAIVLNKGPETVQDFLKQRRRIFAGHLYVKDMLGYRVSTMNGTRIVWLLFKSLKLDWRSFVWAPAIVAIEIFARLRGAYDYIVWKRKPFAWSIAESTKSLAENSSSLVETT
ncbi:MAG: glycosyltransferase [Anaerolineae bacterium]|nr:glycosyltransferase [Anaerolineae bacterium]